MDTKDWHSWPQENRKYIRFNGGNNVICCSGCQRGLTSRSSIGYKEFEFPNRWWCHECVPSDIPVEIKVNTWNFVANPPLLAFREQ